MEKEIKHCLEILRSEGTILYPTDTIWGIGCDATSRRASEKIYRIKQRFDDKSMIILLDDETKLKDYVTSIPEIAWDLLRNVEKPLTIIYSGAKNLAPNVMAKDHSIAIRIVKNKFCQGLIREFGKPIVSTSANISGEPFPLTYQHISREIKEAVDYTVDPSLEELHEVKVSSIIKLYDNGEFRVIRK